MDSKKYKMIFRYLVIMHSLLIQQYKDYTDFIKLFCKLIVIKLLKKRINPQWKIKFKSIYSKPKCWNLI